MSARSRRFWQTHYPDASAADWHNWRWQLRKRIRTLPEFQRIFTLSDAERQAFEQPEQRFSVAITPYFASLLSPDDPTDPLRRTVIPEIAEFAKSGGDMVDPLAEDSHSPVPGIVHRYPDRVLFLVTDFCPVYCRYCTRARLVGGNAPFDLTRRQWQQGIDYIAATPAVRDVLISGGDPLVYDDKALEWLLSRLQAIKHVDYVRIGSKVPVAMPQRITPALVAMLKRYHPLFMSIHLIHPNELTEESERACIRLADAGIPLGSQTVLLRGINDDIETMRRFMRRLLTIRVKPYYLLQCDPIHGSGHFRTPLNVGTDLIAGLRGHVSGYAVPNFIVDLPGGGGKVELVPDQINGHDELGTLFTNFQGRSGFRYPAVD